MPALVMNALQNSSDTMTQQSSQSTTSTSQRSKKKSSRRRRKEKDEESVHSQRDSHSVASSSSSPIPHPNNNSNHNKNNNHNANASNVKKEDEVVPPPPPKRPAHRAKLALLAVHNALRMGGRTQLNLTPPHEARENLSKSLLKKRKKKLGGGGGGNGIGGGGGGGGGGAGMLASLPLRRNLSFTRAPSMSSVSIASGRVSVIREEEGVNALDKVLGEAGLAEYDRAEEEYLKKFKEQGVNSEGELEDWIEEDSSGDEDGLDYVEEDASVAGGGTDSIADGTDYKEALYPDRLEATTQGNAGGTKACNIAFNFRKLKWFDAVTASDRAEARKYLRKELASLKKKDVMILTQHLKKLQRREKRKMEIEAGASGRRSSMASVSSTLSDGEDMDEDDPLTQSLHPYGVSSLPNNMTPSLAAALVMESLSMTPKESLEGMAKCYEGIVAAGTALLESGSSEDSNRPSKKELISALTPLLIPTLEKPSGDTILALAKLRKTCGTKRYQRRFVQRIAPSLVRPPNAALWCLKHRKDMEAIFAATELIFDASFEIFSSGWYDRGRTLLADSKRAVTLQAAADQLKRLSASHESDGLINALSMPTRGMRRSSNLINTPNRDVTGRGASNVGTEVLSEREILAVDTHIRQSIEFLFTRNWSRVTLQNAPPRDGESYPTHKKNSGITGGKSKPSIPEGLQVDPSSVQEQVSSPQRTAGPTSNLVSTGSPHAEPQSPKGKSNESQRSKGRRNKSSKQKGFEEATSPPHSPNPTEIEGSFNPARYSGEIHSPIPSSPRKTNSNIPPLMHADPSMSPSHSNPSNTPAPLSPSNSMYNRRKDHNQRFTTNSPGSTGAAQATYLRTLTSTAAERKRTVAACRALRAQIKRFEDAFYTLHGRPPKGAAERQPLATTYAQYREWKRAIRADAACRIQALFRGSSTRGRLAKSGDERIANLIQRHRAGRSLRARKPDSIVTLVPEGANSPNSFQRAYGGVEAVIGDNRGNNKRPVSRWDPQPTDQMGDESMVYSNASPKGPQHSGPYTPRTEASVASSASPFSFGDITLSELQAQKRELKQQLKQYDLNFHKQHGRMPKKVEKEPIRHLYEKYNILKTRITSLEREAKNSAAQKKVPSQRRFGYMENSGSSDDSPSNPPPRNASRSKSGGRSTTPTGTPPGTPTQDLASLKTEKQVLHQMLRSYEKEFFKLQQRQVSSYADIRPVASQYRRYKEIKKSIHALQQAGEK